MIVTATTANSYRVDGAAVGVQLPDHQAVALAYLEMTVRASYGQMQ